MTVVVSHRGLVFEKDLGSQTGSLAVAVDSYDPDATRVPTADSPAGIEQE